eukprot:CAMPEP_0204285358 /NCGR_PEP_ID=MMETSP0468-20130131/50488_1 /ASSEMBLY_ACC=CAM_ASM_000383 /TAXON_ID=2969 /ORGANISM="Oxyrrhis marina" /LENGTH=176 /DNA_ID=CAMNT_0051263183 /DNA_START=157 /DNA_END=687 /DNA_ORIENTATION=+
MNKCVFNHGVASSTSDRCRLGPLHVLADAGARARASSVEQVSNSPDPAARASLASAEDCDALLLGGGREAWVSKYTIRSSTRKWRRRKTVLTQNRLPTEAILAHFPSCFFKCAAISATLAASAQALGDRPPETKPDGASMYTTWANNAKITTDESSFHLKGTTDDSNWSAFAVTRL